MKLRAAIVLLALAAPALAQRGGAHAGTHSGSSAGRGVAGHAGFSASPGIGRPGFSRPSGFAPPARGFRSGPLGNVGYSRFSPPSSAFPRSPYASGRSTGYRPEYRPGSAGGARSGDRGRDRDRFGERRREFDDWRANLYPLWLGYGYPYTIDPGFFDWGNTDDSAYGNSGDNSQYDQSPPPPSYPGPYTDEDDRAAGREQYTAAGSAFPSAPAPPAPATGQSLTLIFKDGRAPVKVENYMMTATVLTDLDSQHYERIPLDQIDLAATQQANRAAGVEFQVPGTSRD